MPHSPAQRTANPQVDAPVVDGSHVDGTHVDGTHVDGPVDDGRRASLVAMIAGDPQRLRRRSISLGVPLDDADDVAQTVLLRAWRSIERLHAPDETGKMCSWLDTIARNAAIDLARQRMRRPSIALEAGAEVADPVNVSQSVETRVILDAAVQAINALPESLRRPLLMSVADEMPAAEIAERLGISIDTARQRIARARKALAGCRESGMSAASVG
ncbi:RNA polymerase sigma factor [Agromyces sp. NPDC058110]|uniref:RNA polymerase sigma factor n=1 Tax=Agromyces sp. NPDC058110 TaxID=3346345 RepID=UPI0036D9CEF7